MCDQENAQAAVCQGAHRVAQLDLGADIERVAGLIEQQGLGVVHQGARD